MVVKKKVEAIIWGAGKIGRGFLAEIFTDAGYHLNFIEYDKELVKKLKEADSYTIFKVMGEDNQEEVVIRDFTVYHSQDGKAISELVARDNTIIAIAVHQSALPEVVKILVPGIVEKARRDPESTLDIILCINMSHPAAYCRELLEEHLPEELHPYLEHNIGLSDSVVMRISPEATLEMLAKDPLAVLNNGYPEMPVNKKAFKGTIPATKMLRPTEQIEAEEKRKIYTLNMAHVMLAYLGTPRGYVYAADSIRDLEIREAVSGALEEAGRGLVNKYGFTAEDMASWNLDIIKTLENPALKDKLSRLGSDSRRKLGKEDRLVGPALLALAAGTTPFYLAQGIAYGFKFTGDDEGSREVQSYLKEKGIEEAIKRFCGLEDGELFNLIKEIYGEISQEERILTKEEIKLPNKIRH